MRAGASRRRTRARYFRAALAVGVASLTLAGCAQVPAPRAVEAFFAQRPTDASTAELSPSDSATPLPAVGPTPTPAAQESDDRATEHGNGNGNEKATARRAARAADRSASTPTTTSSARIKSSPTPTARPTHATPARAPLPKPIPAGHPASLASILNSSHVAIDGRRYYAQNAGKSWSVRAGGQDAVFDVRSGDQWSHDHGRTGVYRSELAGADKWSYGKDIWVSYALNVEKGSKASNAWRVFGQFYQTPDPGEGSYSPAFSMQLGGDTLMVRTRSYSGHITPVNQDPSIRYSVPNFQFGKWNRFVFHIRFERSGLGKLEVWHDGVRRFSRSIPIGYNDRVGPYWKFGSYGGNTSCEWLVKYSGMEISSHSLLSRVSNPLPIR